MRTIGYKVSKKRAFSEMPMTVGIGGYEPQEGFYVKKCDENRGLFS
jgi:hypothetical protein